MKVALLGSTGRLGQVLTRILLEQGYEVIEFNRNNFDLDEFFKLRALPDLKYDLVINTIALTDVDRCESSSRMAFRINSDLPKILAQFCFKRSVPLIHLSTDYVFSGLDGGFYSESSQTKPLSIYGLSKEAGEREVQILHPNQHLIIRTSWLLDMNTRNFLTWFLENLENQDGPIRVVGDQFGSPTSTEYLALKITECILLEVRGLVHVTNLGRASWVDVANFIIELKGFNSKKIEEISGTSLNRVAPRPLDSSLVSIRNKALGLDLNLGWQSALEKILT